MSSAKFAKKDDIYKFIEAFDGLSLITASGKLNNLDILLKFNLRILHNVNHSNTDTLIIIV